MLYSLFLCDLQLKLQYFYYYCSKKNVNVFTEIMNAENTIKCIKLMKIKLLSAETDNENELRTQT